MMIARVLTTVALVLVCAGVRWLFFVGLVLLPVAPLGRW
jgi:hypothetical protein